MASSRKSMSREEDDDNENEEEFEGFDDFTIASSWERFISEIEAVCRLWMVDGAKNLMVKGAEKLSLSKNLYRVKFEVKCGRKSYCMEYYFDVSNDGKNSDWREDLHNIQLLFGVKDFMVIAPVSVSGVILDAPEASKLLSSVAIALSNCGSIWPAFVPVHDPSRKAFIGIQNMGMTFTRRFEADRVGSQVPIRLMHLEGLYELFVSKFALYVADISTRTFDVKFSMKLTYKTLLYDAEDDIGVSEALAVDNTDSEIHLKTQWDDDCPWAKWYSSEDPLKGFELTAIWQQKTVKNSSEMAEIENFSSLDAKKWLLSPVLLPHLHDDSVKSHVGFASQLHNLVTAFDICFDVKYMEHCVSVENPIFDNLKLLNVIPPPTVLDRVLKDLFHEDVQIPKLPKHEHSNSRAIKGAPLESLFSQFCLHALWFGTCNVRTITILWIEFVREIRWFWEESKTLPGVPTDGGIDLSACLIHQKLQMLSICIKRKGKKHDLSENTETEGVTGDNKGESELEGDNSKSLFYSEKHVQTNTSDLSGSKVDIKNSNAEAVTNLTSPSQHSSYRGRRGSSGTVGSVMLLSKPLKMHAPYTQDPPILTEDMHEERLNTIEAFGDSHSFSAMLERNILSSDMSAFKAANPVAIFEDFIRWHSPGDWETDEAGIAGKSLESEVGPSRNNWPPHGRLSKRMSEQGNSWRQIWNDSPSLPASLQKPTLDPIREGEKVLHYLETLTPRLLLGQIICTAFRASLDTLNKTSFGNLKHMKTKIEHLYQTIALSLKPLRGTNLPEKMELVGDLKHLCVVFGHMERLVIFAASVHRKLLTIPRLSEAIFNDYLNFFLPRLESGSESICYDKELVSRQKVKNNERERVTSVFPPPTANQSWRKVLNMGNLLNGHEPVLREIVFSVCDQVGSGRYETRAALGTDTHRMYVCGTSNDLQVALSVISWD